MMQRPYNGFVEVLAGSPPDRRRYSLVDRVPARGVSSSSAVTADSTEVHARTSNSTCRSLERVMSEEQVGLST